MCHRRHCRGGLSAEVTPNSQLPTPKTKADLKVGLYVDRTESPWELEVGSWEFADYGSSEATYATIAITSFSLRFCTVGFMIRAALPLRLPSLKSYSARAR